MKAAIVRGPGQIPVYGDFQHPHPEEGEVLISVAASALSNLTKGRASGAHYSASNAYPLVPGVDGAGRLENGERVYFIQPRAPFGGMASSTVVPAHNLVPIPDELDDVTAAAIANPGMSSWVALTARAKLQSGETVLINGATGSAGKLAVQIARYLGAKKVIATGRDLDALERAAALGAEVAIPLEQDPEALQTQLETQFAEGVDVVLDYLWGSSAQQILIAGAKAGADAVPIRFVQVGASSGQEELSLASSVLRASAIELMGSGLGSVQPNVLLTSIGKLFEAATPAGFEIATRVVPLSAVEQTWNQTSSRERIVYTIGSD